MFKTRFPIFLKLCKSLNYTSWASVTHPDDPQLNFVTILPIDTVKRRKHLLKEEIWWQENIGVHKFGLNKRKDLATVSINLKR